MTEQKAKGSIADLLTVVVKQEASDLILKVGVPPAIRVGGKILSTGGPALNDALMQELVEAVTTLDVRKRFEQESEVDFSYEALGFGRFRVNMFRQKGHVGMVFRYVKTRVPSLEELNLPAEPLKRLALLPRGLVLITGTAGSGKSTTLAAMLDYINHKEQKHIITIEDPIEFALVDDQCVIEQREVSTDTSNFHTALKYAVRQSPDIIMIGEIRDVETMEAALQAAETGHLVLSTLHTVNAMQTVERIMNFFPPHQHAFLRSQLSQLLEGVASMRLLLMKGGPGRIPAVELMLATPTIREFLSEGKTRDLYKAIKEGGYYGTQTFNQALLKILEKDLISLEDAFAAADSPEELKLELRGITHDVAKQGKSFRSDTTKFTIRR